MSAMTIRHRLAAVDLFSGSVLIAKDGRVIFRHAYGLADRQRRTSNTVDTRFRIGSMNKMFTAVAIMQLVEAGKVELSDPLGKYLADYPNKSVASKVTIRHLLSHTGGTGDIFGHDFYAHRDELRSIAERFADALLSHKLLSRDYTELLITGKVKVFAGAKYAYGFEDRRDKRGNGSVGHGGGAPGMNGDLRIYPQLRLRGCNAGEHGPARSTTGHEHGLHLCFASSLLGLR
jgi:Beta-lactamase